MKKYLKILIPIIVIIILIFVVVFLINQKKTTNDAITNTDGVIVEQLDDDLENSKLLIFQIEEDDVFAFSYTDQNNQKLHFSLIDNKWVLDENPSLEVDQDIIREILKHITTLRATQVLDNVNPQDYGIIDAEIEYSISDASDIPTTIKISSKYKDNDEIYYVINDNYEYIYKNDSTILIPTNYDLEVIVK